MFSESLTFSSGGKYAIDALDSIFVRVAVGEYIARRRQSHLERRGKKYQAVCELVDGIIYRPFASYARDFGPVVSRKEKMIRVRKDPIPTKFIVIKLAKGLILHFTHPTGREPFMFTVEINGRKNLEKLGFTAFTVAGLEAMYGPATIWRGATSIGCETNTAILTLEGRKVVGAYVYAELE